MNSIRKLCLVCLLVVTVGQVLLAQSGPVITIASQQAADAAAQQQAEYDARKAEQQQTDRTWYEWFCECVIGWPTGTGFGAPGNQTSP